MVDHAAQRHEMWVRSLEWEDPLGRKWQFAPVFLLGKPHGQEEPVAGYGAWGHKKTLNDGSNNNIVSSDLSLTLN